MNAEVQVLIEEQKIEVANREARLAQAQEELNQIVLSQTLCGKANENQQKIVALQQEMKETIASMHPKVAKLWEKENATAQEVSEINLGWHRVFMPDWLQFENNLLLKSHDYTAYIVGGYLYIMGGSKVISEKRLTPHEPIQQIANRKIEELASTAQDWKPGAKRVNEIFTALEKKRRIAFDSELWKTLNWGLFDAQTEVLLKCCADNSFIAIVDNGLEWIDDGDDDSKKTPADSPPQNSQPVPSDSNGHQAAAATNGHQAIATAPAIVITPDGGEGETTFNNNGHQAVGASGTTEIEEKVVTSKKITPQTVKAELKETFPGIKFSVRRAKSDAIDVKWTDGWEHGASPHAINSELSKYQQATNNLTLVLAHHHISPSVEVEFQTLFEALSGTPFDKNNPNHRGDVFILQECELSHPKYQSFLKQIVEEKIKVPAGYEKIVARITRDWANSTNATIAPNNNGHLAIAVDATSTPTKGKYQITLTEKNQLCGEFTGIIVGDSGEENWKIFLDDTNSAIVSVGGVNDSIEPEVFLQNKELAEKRQALAQWVESNLKPKIKFANLSVNQPWECPPQFVSGIFKGLSVCYKETRRVKEKEANIIFVEIGLYRAYFYLPLEGGDRYTLGIAERSEVYETGWQQYKDSKETVRKNFPRHLAPARETAIAWFQEAAPEWKPEHLKVQLTKKS